MREASTGMLEQGNQAPSPAPDLIPAEHQPRTYIAIGTSDGGTSTVQAASFEQAKSDMEVALGKRIEGFLRERTKSDSERAA